MSRDQDEVFDAQRKVTFLPNTDLTAGKRSRQARIDAIRDFIKANENVVLKISDFKKASNTNTAHYYLQDLMNSGHVVRHKIKDGVFQGHQYTYSWVDEPAPVVDDPLTLSDEAISQLESLLTEWQQNNAGNENEEATALQHLGATKFVMFLKDRKEHATKQ
jgi:predicted transcriptional regulator